MTALAGCLVKKRVNTLLKETQLENSGAIRERMGAIQRKLGIEQ